MQPYSESTLRTMASALESELVERKESLQGDAPKAIRQAVCAFANDLPGHRQAGVVYVGLKDDGRPTGLAVTDDLLRQLADIKTDGNIVPLPTLSVGRLTISGNDVAVVTVQPSHSPPVRFRGAIWIRTGPRRAIASAQDEQILNEKRRHGDAPFDVYPVSTARLADLDARRFEEEYLPGAVERSVLAANDRSLKERFAAAKMTVSTDDPRPTVLGCLVLGIRPQDFIPGAYVQFLRIAGTELSDSVVDETRCDGPVSQMIRCLMDKLAAHNRTCVDITSAWTERRKPAYPMPALQQLALNAVMHRAYENTNAPVRICWFDDRIEFNSPGGPYGVVTAETFGQPGAVDYRNPNLAEAMGVMGWVQRYGVGLGIARRSLADNGQSAPIFRVDRNWVFCTVRAKS